MNETHEPSYYEIALTNRQVMVVFVVLLMSVIAAFLSGVWIGRGEPRERTMIADRVVPAAAAAAIDEADAAGDVERQEAGEVRSLNFFTNDKNASEPEAPLADVVEKPRQDTTLLQDVGGKAPPPIVEEAAPKREPRVAKAEPAPKPVPKTAPKVEPRPPAPAAMTGTPDGFVVQVFSSGDQNQATKVRDTLRASGYAAFLSPVDVDTQTMYRVRVGPFNARAEAETAASHVKRDFKYDTWITR